MPSPQISPAELAELIAEDPRLRVIDVRTGGEFETMHVPGSYNVPLDALGEHQRDLVDLGEPVVLVCQAGGRARRAEEALLAGGLENVRVLAGGIDRWHGEQRAVATIRTRWTLERQVRLVAGAVVLVSVLASAAAPRAKWVAAGIGAGLTFAALRDSCLMGTLLAKLPYNRATETDVADTIARLRAGAHQEIAA